MRKVEEKMINAVYSKRGMTSGNTAVIIDGDKALICLHGHLIATCHYPSGKIEPDTQTFKQYATRTTNSRLQALGIDACIKGGIPHIDGKPLV